MIIFKPFLLPFFWLAAINFQKHFLMSILYYFITKISQTTLAFFFHKLKKKWWKKTAKNIIASPNFLVWKFCGKAQFLHSFGWFAKNYAESVPFHKIPQEIRWNYGIFRNVAFCNAFEIIDTMMLTLFIIL